MKKYIGTITVEQHIPHGFKLILDQVTQLIRFINSLPIFLNANTVRGYPMTRNFTFLTIIDGGGFLASSSEFKIYGTVK